MPIAATTTTPPIVTFYRLIEEAPAPRRADRSGLGGLPTRAYRHCDAVTSAAGFGWHIAPPIDLDLLWDGDAVWWRCEGLEDWLPLGDSAQFPHFAARFDTAAPDHARGYSPPFLTALPEPGLVQVWTGLAARTAPGWSLLLRGPANLPRNPGCEAYEGIVETDRWFGPLFTNLRLTRTGVPLRLRTHEPFLQVQPIPQAAYADAVLGGAGLVGSLDALGPGDWDDYHATIVAPAQDPRRQPGRYAAVARRRRREGGAAAGGGCPFAAAAAASESATG